MIKDHDDLLDTITATMKALISYEEKKAFLEATRDTFAQGELEVNILNKYIEKYDKIIEDQRKRQNEMMSMPYGVPNIKLC